MNIKNKFCHNCGVKLIPTAKFCPDCGTSQASLSAKPPTQEIQPTISKPKPQNTFTPISRGDDDDDDDSYIDHIDHLNVSISSLEVDYGRPNTRKETIGSVMSEGASLPKDSESFSRPTPPPIDNQTFMNQFRNEAGTLRNK